MLALCTRTCNWWCLFSMRRSDATMAGKSTQRDCRDGHYQICAIFKSKSPKTDHPSQHMAFIWLWLHFALAYLGDTKTCIQHKWGMVRYQQLWLCLLHVVCSCIPANLRCGKDQESMMLQRVKCQRGTATHRQWSTPISGCQQRKMIQFGTRQCKQATSKPVYQTSF